MLRLLEEHSRHVQDTEAQINIACSGAPDSYGGKIDTLVLLTQQCMHPRALCPTVQFHKSLPRMQKSALQALAAPRNALLQLQKAMHPHCAQALSLQLHNCNNPLGSPVTMLGCAELSLPTHLPRLSGGDATVMSSSP